MVGKSNFDRALIDIALAKSGEVDLPYFHDSFVIGVRLEGRKVGVTVEQENGRRVELLLHGVRALHIDNFRLGNIVLTCRIFRNAQASVADLAPILKGLKPIDPGLWENNVGYPDIIASEIEQGRAVLCIIDATVGCEMTALCERIELKAAGLGRETPVQQAAW
ncbi:hypothetical protein [uncultured Devosia sp.]|uniref:hypothetical protein n=1 Tax=uncultured Devosia sp. TaxID=211434 RepID=UPI002625086A|nr:hypothetical protein [uncultured Devosia sp.]